MSMGDYLFSMLADSESNISDYLECDVMSKCLVLFVEGDTEVEFYKQVVANARKLHPAEDSILILNTEMLGV